MPVLLFIDLGLWRWVGLDVVFQFIVGETEALTGGGAACGCTVRQQEVWDGAWVLRCLVRGSCFHLHSYAGALQLAWSSVETVEGPLWKQSYYSLDTGLTCRQVTH